VRFALSGNTGRDSKIYAQIGLNGDISTFNPENLKYGELQAGTQIGETQAVFPRLDKTKIMNEINEQKAIDGAQNIVQETTKTGQIPNAEQTAPNNEQPANEEENFITIDDFLKIELRVGEIKVAERIPKADKLLRFEIDLGEGKPRQILAGLAEYYEPETLIGRKVVVVANLKPRKMRGLESQGMICAASFGRRNGRKTCFSGIYRKCGYWGKIEIMFLLIHIAILTAKRLTPTVMKLSRARKRLAWRRC
jgi:methionyl-tRNA synthetase